MGVLAANKIGPMQNDMNVDVTFEGDNTVMMQQVRRCCRRRRRRRCCGAGWACSVGWRTAQLAGFGGTLQVAAGGRQRRRSEPTLRSRAEPVLRHTLHRPQPADAPLPARPAPARWRTP
jgi:hypothetical protein